MKQLRAIIDAALSASLGATALAALAVLAAMAGCSRHEQGVRASVDAASAPEQSASLTTPARFVTHGANSPIAVGDGVAGSATTYGDNSPIVVGGAAASAATSSGSH